MVENLVLKLQYELLDGREQIFTMCFSSVSVQQFFLVAVLFCDSGKNIFSDEHKLFCSTFLVLQSTVMGSHDYLGYTELLGGF